MTFSIQNKNQPFSGSPLDFNKKYLFTKNTNLLSCHLFRFFNLAFFLSLSNATFPTPIYPFHKIPSQSLSSISALESNCCTLTLRFDLWTICFLPLIRISFFFSLTVFAQCKHIHTQTRARWGILNMCMCVFVLEIRSILVDQTR